MNFGGEARPGSADGIGQLATNWSACMREHAHAGAVDHEVLRVGIGCGDKVEELLPEAALGPAGEGCIDRGPFAKAARQIPPRRSRAQNPQHALQVVAVETGPATTPRGLAIRMDQGVNFFSDSQVLSDS